MIEVKPQIQHQSHCPHCQSLLNPPISIWLGMRICLKFRCTKCHTEIIEELKVGHALRHTCQIDLAKQAIFCDGRAKESDEMLLQALQHPQTETVKIIKEVFKEHQRIIVLNCLDYLYGHCLLKLLNAQRHLEQHTDYGLVIIVPKLLRWLVPQGVAEVWTVDIPLKQGQHYYPSFNQYVSDEFARFDEIQVSEAYSHPSKFNITKFSRVEKHDFKQADFKITFIWREDRLWCNYLLFRLLRKFGLLEIVLLLQNWKIHRFFRQIQSKIPEAQFAIAGLGRKTKFSGWIEDFRVDRFDEDTERAICKVYAQSRLVIGIHGSNMLLPSGHAGMMIDLMPKDRWGNFAQDTLYQESDPRLASLYYQYLPISTQISELAHIASTLILKRTHFHQHFTVDSID